jgi:multiple sugar transport system substrate-binding protein
MKKTYAWFMLLALVLPLVLSGCGTAATEAPTEPPAAAPTEAPTVEEPTPEPAMPAVDPSGQTVTFWHVWGTGTTGEGLQALVDEFNATNEWGITVEALDQGAYNDLEDAMNAAIQSGDLPNIVVGYTNALDTWHSVGVMADLDALINDPDYGLTADEVADYYTGAWENGINASGQRVGFPHGQSENVIFYNNSWAEELGFPNPPANLDEFKAQVCAAAEANKSDPDKAGTGGLVLYTGASNVASFVYGLGDDLRNDAGDGYDFTKPAVEEVASFWKDLWDEGCAFPTESYPNPEFASRKALMTMSSTAGYTYQVSAFEAEGAMHDDVWTFIPFVGDGGTQAVDAYIQNSAIVKSNPEKELASWLFLKWFTSPEINARWIEVSAYYPIRMSAVDLLGDYSAQNPLWAQGLELAPYGKSEPGWASWSTVRRDVQDTFATVLQSDKSEIPSLLDELNATAAEALAETQ